MAAGTNHAGNRVAVSPFGKEAEAVTRQHIISDLDEEGWTEDDPLPRNEEHYKRIGVW